ncbi:hypothetical protein AMTRI_Chr03g48470 [Amborella trichopoda]|uniref:Transmembrane protein n=1 Tax=Amborella trichopoda TaxID=13333 RepID=W1PN24_AMBTC|nr:hypothetical protein AMTR_s00014p00235570 [Amborella trichopoda]
MGRKWFRISKEWASPWKLSPTGGKRKKQREFQWSYLFHLGIIDDFVFKIVAIFESIVLIAILCFFFLCCGCNI